MKAEIIVRPITANAATVLEITTRILQRLLTFHVTLFVICRTSTFAQALFELSLVQITALRRFFALKPIPTHFWVLGYI